MGLRNVLKIVLTQNKYKSGGCITNKVFESGNEGSVIICDHKIKRPKITEKLVFLKKVAILKTNKIFILVVVKSDVFIIRPNALSIHATLINKRVVKI